MLSHIKILTSIKSTTKQSIVIPAKIYVDLKFLFLGPFLITSSSSKTIVIIANSTRSIPNIVVINSIVAFLSKTLKTTSLSPF